MPLSLRRRAVRRRAFAAGARAVVPSLPAMAAWGVVTGDATLVGRPAWAAALLAARLRAGGEAR